MPGELSKTPQLGAIELLREFFRVGWMISARVGRTLWQRVRRTISGPDFLEQNTERTIAQLSDPALLLLSRLRSGGMRAHDLRRVLFEAREDGVRVEAVIVELSAAGLIDSDFPDYQFIRPELLPTVRRVLRDKRHIAV